MDSSALICLTGLTKIYRSGGAELTIFRDLNLRIEAGDQISVIGESGAGKSTLLHLIAGLDTPTSGAIYYKGTNLTQLSEPQLSAFRNREIGYVWQQHHLLPEFTAAENVMMPLMIQGKGREAAQSQAQECLEDVGLGARGHHRAGELSGGEQQRVAIARALAPKPSLLLADEPTGNLDERTGQMIFAMLSELRQRRNLTSILVTHNLHFARQSGRVLQLQGGTLHQI